MASSTRLDIGPGAYSITGTDDEDFIIDTVNGVPWGKIILPLAPTVDREYRIINISSNGVIVETQGGETINGHGITEQRMLNTLPAVLHLKYVDDDMWVTTFSQNIIT